MTISRLRRVLPPVIVLGALLFRLVETVRGSLPESIFLGELGSVIAILGVGGATYRAFVSARGSGRGLMALTFAVWAALVWVPLLRVAYPRQDFYNATLSGGFRERVTPPAPRGGVFELRSTSLRLGSALDGYVLRVTVGQESQTFSGWLGNDLMRISLPLERGQTAKMYLEKGAGPIGIQVRPPSVPRSAIWFGGLLVALLAAVAEAVTKENQLRGLFAFAVSSTAIYAGMLVPETLSRGWVFGSLLLSLLGGALFILVAFLAEALAHRLLGRPKAGARKVVRSSRANRP